MKNGIILHSARNLLKLVSTRYYLAKKKEWRHASEEAGIGSSAVIKKAPPETPYSSR
jgi:hypothetical protein